MSSQGLSPNAADGERGALGGASSRPDRPYRKLVLAGVGVAVVLLDVLAVAVLLKRPERDWIEILLAGLITGFAIGTVFGLWIARSIGYDPKPKKFSLATGIVVLNACVGFFGFPYVTGHGFWPDDPPTLFYSIGTASTLVTAAMLCLVNFFWHSRDQKRIYTLRGMLGKLRLQLRDAAARTEIAQQSADAALAEVHQARREAEEQRTKAFEARREAEEARQTAHGAQTTAKQAQVIAEREKRWRSNRELLVGRWRFTEYSTQARKQGASTETEIQQELDRDKDILLLNADDTFRWIHPGKPAGLLGRIAFAFGKQETHEKDHPITRYGQWRLSREGDVIFVRFDDGHEETLKIKAVTKTKLTLDWGNEDWEVLRMLTRLE